MLIENPSAHKFLDKSDTCFKGIRGTCDTIYRELRSQGIGVEVCHAPVITPEEKLWLYHVWCVINSPKALQRCVFFMLESALPYVGARAESSRTIKLQVHC